jgi:hypothetical protein
MLKDPRRLGRCNDRSVFGDVVRMAVRDYAAVAWAISVEPEIQIGQIKPLVVFNLKQNTNPLRRVLMHLPPQIC